MTLSNALELGAFVADLVGMIVSKATEAFSKGETITVEQLNASTTAFFESWGDAKDRHWRIVHQLTDDTRQAEDHGTDEAE
jgi:hypothetical protein